MRIPEPLWHLVGDLAQEFDYHDGRGLHSAVIRGMVSAAVAEWNESPYVCQSAKHVVLITGRGEVFYRLLQVLKLNSQRQRLPCAVEMKPEKRKYFLDCCPKGVDQGEWFRSCWTFNCFAAWQGKDINGSLLSSWSDHSGIDSKTADLLINQVRGRFVTREIIVGLRDYVQWREQEPGFDRVDLPIDIPTRNLEISVVVDQELYRSTQEEVANLNLEFRNRESARFSGKEIAYYSEDPIVEVHGHMPDVNIGNNYGAIMSDLKELENRIWFFADHEASNGLEKTPVLGGVGKKRLQEVLCTPKTFLFYNMKWPLPHLGLEVCVGWEKPVRHG